MRAFCPRLRRDSWEPYPSEGTSTTSETAGLAGSEGPPWRQVEPTFLDALELQGQKAHFGWRKVEVSNPSPCGPIGIQSRARP